MQLMLLSWSMFIKGKNSLISILIITLIVITNGLLVFLYEKYWFLKSVSWVYFAVIGFQAIGWTVILYLQGVWRSANLLDFKIPVQWAFLIGFLWSVVQVIWIKQWWTWLNLVSQPFLYGLVAAGVVTLIKKAIDQINKIRHHNVDKNI